MIKKETDKNSLSVHRKFMAPISLDIRHIVKPVLGKKGFGAFDVIAAWEEIVGTETASYTRPVKLSFPKGKNTGGVLHINTAAGAFALKITHNKMFIIDKVNTFFGYRAVADIKISQNLCSVPEPKQDNKQLNPKVTLSKNLQDIINSCEDEELKNSLQKLGEAINVSDSRS